MGINGVVCYQMKASFLNIIFLLQIRQLSCGKFLNVAMHLVTLIFEMTREFQEAQKM